MKDVAMQYIQSESLATTPAFIPNVLSSNYIEAKPGGPKIGRCVQPTQHFSWAALGQKFKKAIL